MVNQLSETFLPLTCLLLLATGCSSSNIQPWQKSVEAYVSSNGGDADALRDVTLSDFQHGFALNGGLDPRNSTDVRGVLLAHKTVADRPWFIYVVGVVKDEKVDDLRVAALSMVNGSAVWSVSNHNSPALKLYRDWGWREWHQRASEKSPIPPQYTTFPREADVFDIVIQGTLAQVTHTPSGARWTCDLTANSGSK